MRTPCQYCGSNYCVCPAGTVALHAQVAALQVFERRYNDMIADPVGARHLLALLSAGNGTADDFGKMLDRISVSRANASPSAKKSQQ